MDSGEYLLFAFGPSSSCTVVSRPLLFRSQLSPGPSPSRPWQILISLLGAAVGAATQTLEMAHTVALVLASVAALVEDDPNIDPSRESATSFSGPALTCKFGSSCKFSHDNAHSPTDQSSGTRPKSQRHTGDGKLLEWKRILRQAKHTTLSSHGAAAGRFFQLGLELMDATSVLPKKPSGFLPQRRALVSSRTLPTAKFPPQHPLPRLQPSGPLISSRSSSSSLTVAPWTVPVWSKRSPPSSTSCTGLADPEWNGSSSLLRSFCPPSPSRQMAASHPASTPLSCLWTSSAKFWTATP